MLRVGKNKNFGNPDSYSQGRELVVITPQARKQGTYIVGTTGTGKSSLLINLISQDIAAGDGVCVLDPHGDLLTEVIARIPKSRLDEVILFDPSLIERPPSLNFFDCDKNDPRAVDLVVSTVIDTLYKLFENSWGPRMEDLLRHSILSLMLHPEPVSLLHLMMLLSSKKQRDRLTARAIEQDPILRSYWLEQFPTGKTRDETYIKNRDEIELVGSSLNKVGRFLVNPIIRRVVSQPRSSLNFRQAMDDGAIVLINLSKGELGADNSKFLGAVLVNQLLIAALSRSDVVYEERRQFHLYVDEYQNFATATFPDLQSEARKYAIDTVVAHQYREQLDMLNRGSSLNVANIISLRVNGVDAQEIALQFDNTPPEPELRFEAIRAQVAPGTFTPVNTQYGRQKLEMPVPDKPRLYSDVHLETANMLAQQQNYEAMCRILEPTESPATLEQLIAVLEPPQPVSDQSKKQKLEYVRELARRRARMSADEIDAYIQAETDYELIEVEPDTPIEP